MEIKKKEVGCSLKDKSCTPDVKIYDTLSEMKRLAKRDATSDVVRKIADKIFVDADGDEALMAIMAFNYVTDNIEYKFDHEHVLSYVEATDLKNPRNTEFVIAPVYSLSKIGKGDCDDMSTALASICIALGLPVRFRIIAWKSDEFSHVYNEIGLHDKNGNAWWIPADCVMGQEQKKTGGQPRIGVEKNPDETSYKIFRAESVRVN